MGNMKPIDSAVVKNETYDVLSADTMGGEYIETIGAACQNPDGYTSGSLFLGKDNDVQHLYRATAAIAFGETIILDTNCTYTTVSGELEGKAEESEVTSLNEALTNEVTTRVTLGAHNLLPFDLAKIKSINPNGTWSGNAYTYNGIVYTFYLNSDGSLNYIDVDGTTTSANNSAITFNNFTVFKKGNYKLSCTPESVGNYAYTRVTRGFDGTTSSTVYDRGDGAALNLVNDSSDAIYIQIVVDASSSVAHAKFRPMICLASDPSTEFTPYAMTNRELTENFGGLKMYYHSYGTVPVVAGVNEFVVPSALSGKTIINAMVKLGSYVFPTGAVNNVGSYGNTWATKVRIDNGKLYIDAVADWSTGTLRVIFFYI